MNFYRDASTALYNSRYPTTVDFYLLTFSRFVTEERKNTHYDFHKNRTHDFRTSSDVWLPTTVDY